MWKPADRIDQYKDLVGFRRLEAQGSARLIEAYASSLFHYFLFAGFEDTASLPEQIAIFRDGNLIGAPFADAVNVTLVLPDQRLKLFLENELGFADGNILGHPRVTVVAADYTRYMLEHPSAFDIIHMAATESLAVPSSGFGSTQDDYLLTVDSMSSAIESLTSDGVLTISRGIQTPPQDNLKTFLTLSEALGEIGIGEPEKHLLLVRGYMAASNMVFRNPLEADRLKTVRNLCRDWALDIEYEPGAGEALQGYYKFQLPGPEGSGDTWLRHTARLATGDRADDLIRSWVFDIRPSTDRRPFFHSFFRWRNLDRFTEYYGRYWFRRSDLGSLILVISLASTALLSFLLILLPHFTSRARLVTGFLAYFPAVGMGYFFLEIVMIRRAALFLVDSHSSVPIVLAAILTSSGAGSLIQERLEWSLFKKTSVALAFLTASMLLFVLPASTMLPWISALDKFGVIFPFLFVIAAAGIPRFFMG